MAAEVIMPALGMAQETGRLVAWVKHAGDTVEKGDIIMEVETDKTTVEVEANASGTLANVTASEGDDVPVGHVIALILAPGEAAPPTAASQTQPATATETQPVLEPAESKAATPLAARMAQAHDIDLKMVPTQGKRITRTDVEDFISNGQSAPAAHGRILASPKARRLAQERGVQLAALTGSGPNGAVLADDVLRYMPAQSEAAESAPVPAPMTQTAGNTGTMWKRMAERLTESWQTVPHFYLKRDVYAGNLLAWHRDVAARSDAVITVTDVLVKTVAIALREHDHVNGSWNGTDVVFNEQINVGLAVAVDEGLLVPVIHGADQMGIVAIAGRRKEIVDRARKGKLKPNDLQGGTFTISNLGMFGIDAFSAIVNPPQAAILAVGRIAEQVTPVDGVAVIQPMLTLTLSCDHRAVDGARGAQFLKTLAERIEAPLSLLD